MESGKGLVVFFNQAEIATKWAIFSKIPNSTVVVWNSQTSTILNGDLKKVAALKEMGLSSMIHVYNDINRAGCGSLSAFNGLDFGLTHWGRAITDELWKRGYSSEDLAKIYGGNKLRQLYLAR